MKKEQEQVPDLSSVAKQIKRHIALNKRKKEIQNLPECPALLSLSELQVKTNLPYMMLHRMIVEENKLPYIRVGRKILVNYDVFLKYLNGTEEIK